MNLDQDDVPSAAEVEDDVEGQQETIDLQNMGEENADDNEDEEDAGGEASMRYLVLEDVVKSASKGITEGTEDEYRRSKHNCPSF